jgi:hypothetical protein
MEDAAAVAVEIVPSIERPNRAMALGRSFQFRIDQRNAGNE